ncbi:MAG TPA: HK97-gp10 family putative phage morphogenesis protein [Dehalococcoidia bacterium]|nr:HK97-gp10 family putative phage morphogenesis protein [Dehalococcoidia bacterium]
MSLRFSIKWDNLDNYSRYLASDMPQAFEESVVEALDKGADAARDRAKELVAVDTGSLQKSIRKERHAWPAGNITYVGIRAGGYVVNPKTKRLVDYAIYVEYGTSRQRPQPYMRPAIIWASKQIEGNFWKALSRRVKVE